MSALPRLRPGLLRHQLDRQFLVYDPQLGRVHLLDSTTAFVFDLLEEGGYSLDKMTSEIARRNNVQPDPAFVSLAFEELRAAGLLDQSETVIPALESLTRRDMVRKLAMSGAAAALVIPTVATLTATQGYAQSSITGGEGGPCGTSVNCGPGLVCCQGICSAQCLGVEGDPCPGGDVECQSGICCGGQCSNTPCGTLESCYACVNDAQCSGGVCNNFGSCGTGNDPNKLPNGDPCGGNGNCCSNHCTNGVCTPT